MGGFPVALTTIVLHPEGMGSGVIGEQFTVSQKLSMAPDAILMHNLLPGLFDEDHLRLFAQGEYCRMTKTILCLEEVFVYKVIMRHMAIVAGYTLPVGAVVPCCVLRCHDMAVDASLRFIANIRGSIGDMERVETQSEKNP